MRIETKYDLLQTLLQTIEDGSLLPPGVSASLIGEQLELPFGTKPAMQPDLLLEIRVGKKQRKILAVVECKIKATPSVVEHVAVQLNRYIAALQSSRPDLVRTIVFPMFAAPHITQAVRERCRELGIGIIDLNGNFYLEADDTYIDVYPRRIQFKPPEPLKTVFARKSRRILRVLLCSYPSPVRTKRLAAAADASPALVSQVLKKLEQDRLAVRRTDGFVLSHPRRTLEMLGEQLRDDRKVFRGYSKLSELALIEMLQKFCETNKILHAFTLFSGLEDHERSVTGKIVSLYTSVNPFTLTNQLNIKETPSGPNIVIFRPSESENTEAGGVFYSTRVLSTGRRSVSLVQAYLDFLLYPSRGREQAQHIVDYLLSFR